MKIVQSMPTRIFTDLTGDAPWIALLTVLEAVTKTNGWTSKQRIKSLKVKLNTGTSTEVMLFHLLLSTTARIVDRWRLRQS